MTKVYPSNFVDEQYRNNLIGFIFTVTDDDTLQINLEKLVCLDLSNFLSIDETSQFASPLSVQSISVLPSAIKTDNYKYSLHLLSGDKSIIAENKFDEKFQPSSSLSSGIAKCKTSFSSINNLRIFELNRLLDAFGNSGLFLKKN